MNLEIDKSWTLFLDRDGVINQKRENDYVKNWSEFSFLNGSLEAISILSNVFERVIIVTNQRGVGKGVMKEEDLILIHNNMIREIKLNSGRIDQIYYCTDVSEFSFCRKPNPGMGIQASLEFPEIIFDKSIIVGDSISDLEFGKKLGLKIVFINNRTTRQSYRCYFDFGYESLLEFANSMDFEI